MPDATLLSIRDARVVYGNGRGRSVTAVDGISLDVRRGETLGIVGESGCGKSSLALWLVGLATGSGAASFDGHRVDALDAAAWKALRRRIQYIFQDPLGSLDPRMSVLAQVCEPLDIHRIGVRNERSELAREMLHAVGIGSHLHRVAPLALSGGQRQRVGIARALVLRPELLICDEPVSGLDVLVQAQVLELLTSLGEAHALTMIFISHDLAVVRHVSQRIAVLYCGRVVETGPVDEIYAAPAHPYTRALLDALPAAVGDPRGARTRLKGETPRAGDRPLGCAFAARCPSRAALCERVDPALEALGAGRATACHFPLSLEHAA